VTRRQASLLCLLALAACAKPKGAQGLAEAFIDHYYIERDHTAALGLAQGIAATRVAEERKLVEEARGAGADTSQVQPHLYYAWKRTVPKGSDIEFTYLLTIDSGGVPLKKEVRVVVTPGAQGMRVSFFNESDL